ncbi:lysoplasmalogenase family protein [Rhodobacter sp. JA431]|uniref:lysoplasmalogenase family protein n=1 Tax=Rhodobacter sp. JA431 TaxID=570013 RepID=UPI000BE43476|nr:lysoplasmalogenase family protein [Rhodobacter sp. JA431]
MSAVPLLALPFFCAALVLALWQGVAFVGAPASWRKSFVKTGAVWALAAGLVLSAPAGTGAVILTGLVLGGLGDFFLSRPGQGAFLAGMVAFALGHLAYAAAFFALGRAWPDLWPALGAGALAALAFLFLAPRAGALKRPVQLYIGVIWIMVLAALRVDDPRIFWGALCFMASDFILALELFALPPGRVRRAASYAVWALYWPAQALIAWSALG